MENDLMMSPSIDALVVSLSAAQGEWDNPFTSATNPHFRSKYVPLHAGIDAVKKVLAKHGLAFIQQTYVQDNFLFLRTFLAHKSGQWIASTYPVIGYPAKNQEAGSALTNSRRYALYSLLGIAGDPDDDSNSAPEPIKPPPPKAKVTPKPEPETVKPMTEAESSEAMQDMMGQLIQISTRAELMDWRKRNKPIKDRMTKDDQAMITQAYNQIDEQVKD